MFAPWDNSDYNDAFWRQDAPFVAGDMPGLLEFAARSEATSNLIFFRTSGSEGAPKWVGLSRAAFFASATSVNCHLEAKAHDRWLIALPLVHVGGFSILARAFYSGASWLQMPGKWEAQKFADLCEAEGVTLTSLVSTQVYDLVQAGLSAPKSLRAIVVGGGALSRGLGTRAMELGWPVLQSYGMTETASQVATEPLDHLYAGFDPDSLEVLPGWQLGVGEDDCLTVHGPALASGYAVQEDGQWKWLPIDHEAGFKTRDHVHLWQHGARRFLSFQGRDASYVKVLGELVNLTALKKRLDECAGALGMASHELVIWPVEDARKGTRLILAGTADTEPLEILRTTFNTTAPGYERIDEVRQLPALPYTTLGKLDRPELERMLAPAV